MLNVNELPIVNDLLTAVASSIRLQHNVVCQIVGCTFVRVVITSGVDVALLAAEIAGCGVLL
jgi:hypothetical protein